MARVMAELVSDAAMVFASAKQSRASVLYSFPRLLPLKRSVPDKSGIERFLAVTRRDSDFSLRSLVVHFSSTKIGHGRGSTEVA